MTTAFTTITLRVGAPLSTLTLGPAGPATFAPLIGTPFSTVTLGPASPATFTSLIGAPLAVTLLVRPTLSPART